MFNVGDIIQYTITGGWGSRTHPTRVVILSITDNTYTVKDLSSYQVRSIAAKTLRSRNCALLNWKELTTREQEIVNDLSLPPYVAKEEEVKSVTQVKTPALNIVSVHDIKEGECIQTNTTHYLGIALGQLLELTTLNVVSPDAVEDKFGVRRSINISIQA